MGLNEADTRAKLVDPRLSDAGWQEPLIQRELSYKRGRVRLIGEHTVRDRPQFVDYVLRSAPRGQMLAVVEAKDESHDRSAGLQQALGYAQDLGVFFAYSTNGHGIVEHDRLSNTVTDLDAFPSPEELDARLVAARGARSEFVTNRRGDRVRNPVAQPAWPALSGGMRWYQEAAVTAALESMVGGNRRALLSLATGTGKTFIAFNLCWKLIQSGYARKVLFLADRVALRDQAYNEFGAFDAARGIASGGTPPFARDIHFGIYQGLYTPGEDGTRMYEKYPKDFFDLVVIDECHRSGYGDWQAILEHFSSAFHLGLTATPKRTDNIDTYEFFASENRDVEGQPRAVFEYSLSRGIEDGYLATYKVRQVRTSLDQNGLRIDEELELGADLIVPEGGTVKDLYTAAEFERLIVIDDRTRQMCEHLAGLLRTWGVNEKTMVFCVTMEHAARVRDHLQRLLGPETGKELYAARIVSEESNSEALLEQFQLSGSREPVVATTVDLLSTGVNVPACRNIVFMKPVGSPTVFKQIIGRGTRLDAATGKEFFRIVDYTNATRLLDEWDLPSPDGGPISDTGNGILSGKVVVRDDGSAIEGAAIAVRGAMRTLATESTDSYGLFHIADLPETVLAVTVQARGFTRRTFRVPVSADSEQLVIDLREPTIGGERLIINGVEVTIAEEVELVLGDGGELSVQEYLDHAGEQIRTASGDVVTLNELWRDPQKRRSLLDQLREHNADPEVLATLLQRPDADEYDLLAHTAFREPIRTREQRARRLEEADQAFLGQYSEDQQRIVAALIDKYRLAGVEEISTAEVFSLTPFAEHHGGLRGLVKLFGGATHVAALLKDLQSHLYETDWEPAA